MPEPRVNFTVRLSKEGRAEIDKLAKQDNRTRSDMARILLGEAVAGRAKREKRSPGDHDWQRLRELEREFGTRGDDE